jgi:RNA polymerase sigma factor (sigma-70 family)
MEESRSCREFNRVTTRSEKDDNHPVARERHERFKEVVLPHLGDAARLARLFTRSRSDAEDVLQEASVRMLRFIDAYRGGDARAWVLRVTRNTAFTWLRRNRRPNHIGLPEPHDDFAVSESFQSEFQDEQYDPFGIEAARSESAALHRAISGLPSKQRDIVVLRDIKGMPYADIASALSIPLGTVMSRLSRTHAALRLQLGQPQMRLGIHASQAES